MPQNKIPTNHGVMGIESIFDHLNYVSYRVQRESGMTAVVAAKWYTDAGYFEQVYIKEKRKTLLYDNQLKSDMGFITMEEYQKEIARIDSLFPEKPFNHATSDR